MENLEEKASNHRAVIINKVANGISRLIESLRTTDELPSLSNGRHLVIGRPLNQPESYFQSSGLEHTSVDTVLTD